MEVSIQSGQGLWIPERDFAEDEHVQLWVSGYVHRIDKTGRALIRVRDWGLEDSCHCCGRSTGKR